MIFALLASAAAFTLSSHAIARDGATLPDAAVYRGYGCTGSNISPDLEWSGAPKGTKSFVLTMYDPDAPVAGGWWHWSVFDIPASAGGLKENAGAGKVLPAGAQQGKSSFGSSGYGGPCPPPGKPHHYVFTLYALDVASVEGASADTTGLDLLKLIDKHSLGKATLTGMYGRS